MLADYGLCNVKIFFKNLPKWSRLVIATKDKSWKLRRVILQEFEKDRKIDIKRKERKKKERKNRQIDRQSQDYALYTARQT